MSRIALVTVSDEGAAEMVRAALVNAGIQPEFERAYLDDPYRVSIYAEPWRVFVPEDQLEAAQAALARLEHDVADEVEAQAMAWRSGEDPRPESGISPAWRPPKPAVAWALGLAALLPFLAFCFYARVGAEPARTTPTLTRPPSTPDKSPLLR
jgi:Putative prokaryotic signal transducing protein